ncbi:MAG: hypothetical protein MJ198_03870 [Bacteroidales bacterium]|nr:hypothetical protein [Bacteroidales bacterium]
MNTRQIKTICFVFIFCSLPFSIFSQETQYTSGTFSGKGSILSYAKNVWAIQTNPALLAFCAPTGIGVSYITNYSISDMVCARINACTQMKQISCGTSLLHYGNLHFSESYFSTCFSRKINSHNAIGIKFNILSQKQEEYGTSRFIFPELSYYGEFEKTLFGISIVNPLQIVNRNKYIHSTFAIQGEYKVSKLISIGGNAQLEDNKMEVAIGSGFTVNRFVKTTITYRNTESPVTFAIQIPLHNFVCEYETSINFYLGFSHMISFFYSL